MKKLNDRGNCLKATEVNESMILFFTVLIFQLE